MCHIHETDQCFERILESAAQFPFDFFSAAKASHFRSFFFAFCFGFLFFACYVCPNPVFQCFLTSRVFVLRFDRALFRKCVVVLRIMQDQGVAKDVSIWCVFFAKLSLSNVQFKMGKFPVCCLFSQTAVVVAFEKERPHTDFFKPLSISSTTNQ